MYFTLPSIIKEMFDIYIEKNAYNQSKYIEKLIIEDIKKSDDYNNINNMIKKEKLYNDNK